jgi:hypothetical protein
MGKYVTKLTFTFYNGKGRIELYQYNSFLAILPEIEISWGKIKDKRQLGVSFDWLRGGIILIMD